MAQPKRGNARPPSYKMGDIYSFKTSPFTEFSPPATGRYAAFKVIGLMKGCVCYVVLDGVFSEHPKFNHTSNLRWLRLTRGYNADKQVPAVCNTPLDWENELKDFRFVGNIDVTSEEEGLANTCQTFGSWSGASISAEAEWLYRNDRSAYERALKLYNEQLDARMAAEKERYKNRLKTLTWEKFLSEQPFSRWNSHPPFPPKVFVDAARACVRQTASDLRELGPKPKKAAVRSALKACVEWFNVKDAEFGNVIETEEREDICSVLEELAHLARQKSLVEEIHDWREW